MLPFAGLLAISSSGIAAHSHGPGDLKTGRQFDALAKVPEKARARVNPFENDPRAPAAGRILYEQHCSECHGTVTGGGKKAPNLGVPEVRGAMPGALFWILSNGVVRRGMPDWSKLPEPERWQIVAFLKSLPPATDAAPAKARTGR
jgi:mono/diheme cytochrome c family protein